MVGLFEKWDNIDLHMIWSIRLRSNQVCFKNIFVETEMNSIYTVCQTVSVMQRLDIEGQIMTMGNAAMCLVVSYLGAG